MERPGGTALNSDPDTLPARKRMLVRMQQIVARDLPALALYHPSLFSVYRKQAFDAGTSRPAASAPGRRGSTTNRRS